MECQPIDYTFIWASYICLIIILLYFVSIYGAFRKNVAAMFLLISILEAIMISLDLAFCLMNIPTGPEIRIFFFIIIAVYETICNQRYQAFAGISEKSTKILKLILILIWVTNISIIILDFCKVNLGVLILYLFLVFFVGLNEVPAGYMSLKIARDAKLQFSSTTGAYESRIMKLSREAIRLYVLLGVICIILLLSTISVFFVANLQETVFRIVVFLSSFFALASTASFLRILELIRLKRDKAQEATLERSSVI